MLTCDVYVSCAGCAGRRFVVVSVLGNRQQTPVSKRTVNPTFNPKDATFDFPIYLSLADRLGVVELVIWDKDMLKKDYLGETAIPLEDWFRDGSAFAFDDMNNNVSHRRSPARCSELIARAPEDDRAQPAVVAQLHAPVWEYSAQAWLRLAPEHHHTDGLRRDLLRACQTYAPESRVCPGGQSLFITATPSPLPASRYS